MTMELSRAREIVQAINARCFVTIGLDKDLPSLEDVSLGEMMEATNMVRNANQAARAAAEINGGGCTISIVPDDRLIAAVYTLHHYPCSREPILSIPFGAARQHVVAVLAIPNPTDDDEEDEE
ncbi:hypothetical protein ACRQ5Q_22585 [Bradyrhizobium sp. PMVTL-01]|uniref:hypothetical protein n=1 Tax=Bradyrhizobium sp. PMVTL-01 TaxID=3434999 RepID=UPI003F6F8EEB